MSGSRFVIATLTGLYAFNVVQTATQWVILTKLLGLIGEPLLASFLFVGGLTPWIQTLNDVMLMFTSVLADALLVMPFILHLSSTTECSFEDMAMLPCVGPVAYDHCGAFCLSRSGVRYVQNVYTVPYDLHGLVGLYMVLTVNGRVASISARTINARVTGAAAFLTFSTTLICTVLIVYRIYASSHKEGPFRNRQMFSNIVEMLIQSAAVYAATAFVFAVAQLLVAHPEFHGTWWVLDAYAYALYTSFAVSGS